MKRTLKDKGGGNWNNEDKTSPWQRKQPPL